MKHFFVPKKARYFVFKKEKKVTGKRNSLQLKSSLKSILIA